jgi:hypothetical protein
MSRASRRAVVPLLACAAGVCATSARAGSFDPQGNFAFDPSAVVTDGFETLPACDPKADAGDGGPAGIAGLCPKAAEDALEGATLARLEPDNWWEWVSVPVVLPSKSQSVRARIWARRGDMSAVFQVTFKTGPARRSLADMFPTGRCTSDGWVELESAPVSVDGADFDRAAVSMRGEADVDALEIVAAGAFSPTVPCRGAFDTACGEDRVCLDGACRDGAHFVPPLPPKPERDRVVDWLESRLRFLFGGHWTRSRYLPAALEEMTSMRTAPSAWRFWNGFATAVRKLHDWHTRAGGLIQSVGTRKRLNLCFLEGDADLSHAQWASDPKYLDLLVSHVGPNRTMGLKPGDRLIGVDGQHPIAWARSLVRVDWGWWQADDDAVSAEFAERMRGLIPAFAKSFTVLRCDAQSMACADAPEVLDVASIPDDTSDEDTVRCDNRPAYHLADGPDPVMHTVDYTIYKGLLVDSKPGENLYGMTWDTLWGPAFTPAFKAANDEFKASARGVILDHRAGNGGTVDAPEAITELVRDTFDIAIFPYRRPSAGFEGPATKAEALAIFDHYKIFTNPDLTYTVGSGAPDKKLPVALLTHRDGSASDYLPYGMKGAPKVRIFGPHATAGAFSSFFDLNYHGSFGVQIASGDTITFDGEARIGHGVEPDEIVQQKQSDLIRGRDTIYERALAWVRAEMKP